MYVVVVGAGKVGWNLARELLDKGNELTVVESDPARYAVVEEEVPRVGLLHLLDLPQERLEIIEIEVLPGSPAAGKMVKDIGVPEGSLVISILRDGTGFVPLADSVVEAGDEVLLVLDTGLEDKITARFDPNGGSRDS